LAEALDSIVRWHRAFLAGDDMHAYCHTEIARFTADAL
jgi:CDP-glucose 4,6-dehydratase